VGSAFGEVCWREDFWWSLCRAACWDCRDDGFVEPGCLIWWTWVAGMYGNV